MAKGHLGVTEPICLSRPTEVDVIRSLELKSWKRLDFLADAGLYPSYKNAVCREEVLGRLHQVVMTWIKLVSSAKGYSEQFVQEASAKIFTFGSYHIGVHGPGANIDTLCVGPWYATRELHNMLAAMPEVAELHPVPDAHVPIMKFKFTGGVQLTLCKSGLISCSRSAPAKICINIVYTPENVDEETARSLNGCRVTDLILGLVPNIQVSCSVLLVECVVQCSHFIFQGK
ncbi:poly(A) polymerase PAPalpha isoform X1 [Carex littledalei]|uniref:Poly(A) polymerase PAPalpha isoform X1 n=1 Tax=Carex littledalei TaxID=544730 RepID=A0A833VM87_9POAL|nr:poly(A) polymerase PAPalpha isoform X1 [Carex littledalei]